MKLHELKQKRNTIATDMRALNEKIGDNAWTEEQRTEWNKAKSELEALDEEIPALEQEKADIEARLASGQLTADEIMADSQRHAQLIELIDEKSMRWLELSDI